jgi:hypothetical protein
MRKGGIRKRLSSGIFRSYNAVPDMKKPAAKKTSSPTYPMRSRERILANLEALYRESYERAKQAADNGRMIDLDSAFMRDQLMLEILLDIRDLFSVAPAASGGSALEKLEAVRRLAKFP